MSTKPTVAFHTLGCKLNFSETSTIKRSFEKNGYQTVPFDAKSDVYVLNTCSVTQDANKDARKFVRRVQRQNPDSFIAVVGCYAQLEPEEIAAIEGVDVVLGAKNKFKLFDLIEKFEKQEETLIFRSDVNEAVDFHNAFSSDDRTRAFLKIQDGCNFNCAFCTIPLARGASRSPSIDTVVTQAKRIVDAGYKEIVITGVNSGDFGYGTDQNLLMLLEELTQLEGMERIRVSSIEPNLLHDDIIHLVAESSIMQPHFHIPLQSGSDFLLKKMRRRYLSQLYADKVALIKKLMPHACIGADVITGHPGETQEIFQESLEFIKAIDVSYLHAFTYSERPNTRAIAMDEVVPKDIRKKRTHILRDLSDKKRIHFDQQFAGSTRRVLFESANDTDFIYGWSDNYLRVKHPMNPALQNQIIDVPLADYDLQENVFMAHLQDQKLLEDLAISSLIEDI
jgi:threonylcarbamoyladenosine tRNA methylthiotransferase MtaB